MYVLPLKNDVIFTSDGTEYSFLEYAGNRALWVSESNADPIKISMDTVVKINKTPVKVQGKSCFIAAIPLSSRAQLPQKKDELTHDGVTWDVVQVNLDPKLSVKVKSGVNTTSFNLKDFKSETTLTRVFNTYWQYL
jgi:hypothetical protein